jgi:hypothetical protein
MPERMENQMVIREPEIAKTRLVMRVIREPVTAKGRPWMTRTMMMMGKAREISIMAEVGTRSLRGWSGWRGCLANHSELS